MGVEGNPGAYPLSAVAGRYAAGAAFVAQMLILGTICSDQVISAVGFLPWDGLLHHKQRRAEEILRAVRPSTKAELFIQTDG